MTDASSGIGRAVALECVRLGATVLACGREAARLDEGRDACAAPDRWLNIKRDFLENPDALPDWVRELARAHGRLWGLVQCAGMGLMDTLRGYDYGRARVVFNLNFNVPMLLAQGMADRRVHMKGGAIVFVTSAAAMFPEKGHLIYGASKAALAAAAKSMSQEVAPLGLRVNCVAPGIVETPMQARAEAFMGDAYRQRQLAAYPFGFGVPEDVAHMAVFLVSSQAAWITGQNFVLAGGRY